MLNIIAKYEALSAFLKAINVKNTHYFNINKKEK